MALLLNRAQRTRWNFSLMPRLRSMHRYLCTHPSLTNGHQSDHLSCALTVRLDYRKLARRTGGGERADSAALRLPQGRIHGARRPLPHRRRRRRRRGARRSSPAAAASGGSWIAGQVVGPDEPDGDYRGVRAPAHMLAVVRVRSSCAHSACLPVFPCTSCCCNCMHRRRLSSSRPFLQYAPRADKPQPQYWLRAKS
jgi:hypothetical protein